jgi:Spy/CpxP family protein refolding chaperone
MKLSTNTFAMFAAMLALTLTFLFSSSVAIGQEGNAGQNKPGYSGAPGAVNPTIDDATLKHTAKAFVKVRQIEQKARQALNNTNDDAQKRQITAQAESDKIDAVKAEGLRPQQYNRVIELAQADKTVQQKFLSYVNEVKNSPS